MVRALLIAAAALCAAPLASALTLTGLDGRAMEIAPAQIASMTHTQLVVTQHNVRKRFSGPLLADVLKIANAPAGEKLKGPDLSDVVLVTAKDGYVVAFALAETDPAMRKDKMILADKMDGKPIPAADGPLRLVVEGDLRPARSERQVEKIEIRRLK